MNARGFGRRGSLLLDAAMATALLGIALAATLHILTSIAAQRRAADRRAIAQQLVANALDAFAAKPWAELTPGTLADPAREVADASTLPQPRWDVSASDAPTDGPWSGLRQIAVALHWRDTAGQPESSVRLVTWVSSAGRGAP